MGIQGEHDRVESEQDPGAREQEPSDADQAAEQRLARYRSEGLECEHFRDQTAEAEAIRRSAEILIGWERRPEERRYLLERVGQEMMSVHEAPNSPIFPDRLKERGLLGENDENWNRIDERLLDYDDPREALETYLHEYRHDEQRYEVQASHGSLRHQVDLERAAKLEWAIDHYHSSREAQEFVDQDAQSFAVEMSSRILEKRSELKAQNGVPGEASGGEISSPGDEIARRRLSEDHRGAERSESGR